MLENHSQYIIYFLCAFISSLFLTPIVGKLGWKFKILALPPSQRKDSHDKDRHLEKPAVPSIGGIAVFIPFILITLISGRNLDLLLWILIPTAILHIGGLIDSIRNLSYKVQIFYQLFAIFIFILSPITVNSINIPGLNRMIDLAWTNISFVLFNITFSISLIGDILLGLWVLVIINAYKLNGGTCALIEGNSAIAGIIIFLVSVSFGGNASAIASIIFVGSVLGFAIFNFHPWKIYGGSSAKTIYGFIIASLAVVGGAKLATTFMVAALPIVDMVFVILQRVVEKKTIDPNAIMRTGDTRHLHHKLLRLGFSEPKIAFFEYSVTLIVGLVGVSVSGIGKLIFLLLVPILMFALIFYITQKSKQHELLKQKEETKSSEERYSY